jgi:hypothetical protein
MAVHRWSKGGRRTGLALLSVGLSALAAPSAGAAPVERLCIPRVGASAPIVGDGTLDEPGWTGALRQVFSNGTPRPHGALQAITDGTTLFLAVEAYHAPGAGGLDAAVLGFQVGAGPARALTARLVAATAPAAGPRPASLRRRAEVALLVAPGLGGQPGGPWTEARDPGWPVAASSGGGGGGWWFVEAAIPIADLGLPPRGSFAFHAAILRSAGRGEAVELAWPPGALNSGSLRGLPDPATWGTATLEPAGCRDRPAAAPDLAAAHLRNTRLGVAERSSATWVVSAGGQVPAPAGATVQVAMQSLREGVLLRSDGVEPRYSRDATVAGPLWTLHAYRRTGRWFEVDGTTIQLLTPLDSFGSTVQHQGTSAAWPSELSTRIDGVLVTEGDEVYHLEIPPSGKVVVSTTIEVVEPVEPTVPPSGCGCRRLPGGLVGLAAFGLLAFAPRTRGGARPAQGGTTGQSTASVPRSQGVPPGQE